VGPTGEAEVESETIKATMIEATSIRAVADLVMAKLTEEAPTGLVARDMVKDMALLVVR
jgi:hypothetical protein